MASLTETLVPFDTYNSLPHIRDVANAPEEHANDLKDLRELLDKHKVPKDVSIRLIHKHFDTKDGEVMIFDKVTIPGHGIAQIMKPVVPGSTQSASRSPLLCQRPRFPSGLRVFKTCRARHGKLRTFPDRILQYRL